MANTPRAGVSLIFHQVLNEKSDHVQFFLIRDILDHLKNVPVRIILCIHRRTPKIYLEAAAIYSLIIDNYRSDSNDKQVLFVIYLKYF